MKERHLREATADDAEHAKADLVATEILAEFGIPGSYERAQNLLAVAYLRGGQDALRWAEAKLGGTA